MTKRNSNTDIAKMRNNFVVKSNELIQKRTHMMTLQEQKILLFLISQLKPEQDELELMSFDIVDFCEMCGIESQQGRTYRELKKTILDLTNKGFWVVGENKERTMRWIDYAEITPSSGVISIQLDKAMTPFLLQLKERYTQYELIYTLGMKSKYSVRLYEILKSYQRINESIHFEIPRFKELVGADYEKWYDIKRFVVEPALKEINKLSDIYVEYITKKKGRLVSYIDFTVIEKKGFSEQVATRQAIAKELDGTEPLKGQLMLDGSFAK